MLKLLRKRVRDDNILWLLQNVIESSHSEKEDLALQGLALQACRGIPLGNLTSQIFANIYLNELDQFVKHKLKIKCYLRYADDFIILSSNKKLLYQCIDTSQQFLRIQLRLELHPQKIIVRKLSWGVDFLGYIVLPHYILPRTKTKKRLFRKIDEKIWQYQNGEISKYSLNQTSQSYLGYLSHSNSYKLRNKIFGEWITNFLI